jgi:hypothetical protein
VPIKKCGKIYIICLAKQAIIWSVLFFKSVMEEWSLLENRENRIGVRYMEDECAFEKT